jgi:hypothetical protein
MEETRELCKSKKESYSILKNLLKEKMIVMTQKVKRIIFTIIALLLVIILCGLILAHFPVRK